MIIKPMGFYINSSTPGLPPYFNIQPTNQAVSPAAATFGLQPQNVYVVTPNTATFSVSSASPDGGTLSYQWQYSTDNGVIWNNVTDGTGGTTASYTTPTITTGSGYNNRKYRCLVTNTKSGLSTTFTSQALDPESGSISYLWYSSPSTSTGVTTQNLTLTSASIGMSGSNPATGTYYCKATDPSTLETNSNTVTATIYSTTNSPSGSGILFVNPVESRPTTWLLGSPTYGTPVWAFQTYVQSYLKPSGDNYLAHTQGYGYVSWEDANIPVNTATIAFNYQFDNESNQYGANQPETQYSDIQISYDDGLTYNSLYDYTNNRPLSSNSTQSDIAETAFSIQCPPTVINLSSVSLRVGISANYNNVTSTCRPSSYTPTSSGPTPTFETPADAYSGSGGASILALATNQVSSGTLVYSGFTNPSLTPISNVLHIDGLVGNVTGGTTVGSSVTASVSIDGGLNWTTLYVVEDPLVTPIYNILPYSLTAGQDLTTVKVKIIASAGRIGGEAEAVFGQIYVQSVGTDWKSSSRSMIKDIKAVYT